jgi:hypothetical protein
MQVPPILYKYASAETAKIVLQTQKLRWSSPRLFNDLAEFERMPRFDPPIADSYAVVTRHLLNVARGTASIEWGKLSVPGRTLFQGLQMFVHAGMSDEEILATPIPRDKHADTKVENALREHFSSLDLEAARVLCVTTDSLNEVMWANYAGTHSGCCLAFQHVPALSTPLLAAKQVSYEVERPIVGSGVDFLLYGDSQDLRSRTMHAVCYTKKVRWSYEQEWRALTWRREENGKNFGDYKFFREELKEVLVGARASDETLAIIRQLLSTNYPQAKLYKVEARRGELVSIEIPVLGKGNP